MTVTERLKPIRGLLNTASRKKTISNRMTSSSDISVEEGAFEVQVGFLGPPALNAGDLGRWHFCFRKWCQMGR